jgi:uroporphyrin-3 C-methyltransferase
MTEPTHNPEQLPALTAPPARRPPAFDRIALGLAGVALLGVAVLAWFAWQGGDRLDATRQELSRRLADGETLQKEAQAHAKQNREALDALQAKVGALEARLAEMQSQQMALETMYQELSRVREDRLLAEIEQEVAIAAQQLQLAGNVEAALIALSGAEARLARNAQPQFLPLRKLIARDIERLKALPGADVPGIALRLDSLLNAVPGLPLAFEQRPAAAKSEKPAKPKQKEAAAVPPAPTADAAPSASNFAEMLRAWGGDIWRELRQLVRIERIDRPDPGLLAPRETFFLRENLKLRLLSARLALLARDGRSFKGDIAQADAWLEAYFDVRAPAVQEARATLATLGKLDVAREPAELNETLSALRNFKLARDRR